ncbi:hypothetical protein SLE2022_303220 [Rubroshorea leprosula]
MAKRFKIKISRVFPFKSCRSRHPSTLPFTPVPSFSRLPPVNLHFPPPPPPPPSSKPYYSSIKRHVSSAFSSMGCSFGSRSSSHYLSDTDYTDSPPPPTPEFHWEKDHKWHVIAKVQDDGSNDTRRLKIAESFDNDGVLPSPPRPNTEDKQRLQRKKKTTSKIRISTTSSGDSGLFSSESFDDEETETLVSPPRSFSTDSSTRRHKKKGNKGKVRRCILREMNPRLSSASESESPARLSLFLQRMISSTVEGKVRESFAVVKRSEDPYEDFKRSMVEMILEKQMFEEKDLEQLLQCFLSLNSQQHHEVIVQAFVEIWEALFCGRSSSFRVS